MDNILDNIREAVEGAIKPILKRSDTMTPVDLEILTKAVCIIETVKRCQCHYGDNNSVSDSNGYSRRYYNGYSGHSIQDRMIDKLERMMDEAQTEHERQTVQTWINRLRT